MINELQHQSHPDRPPDRIDEVKMPRTAHPGAPSRNPSGTTIRRIEQRRPEILLARESLAEREAKWPKFQADPEWIKVRTESEADGPINANVANYFLQPTTFSSVK